MGKVNLLLDLVNLLKAKSSREITLTSANLQLFLLQIPRMASYVQFKKEG